MLTIITESDLTPQQADILVKAKKAMDMNNFGYAVNLLKALVKNAPGFLDGRKLLRTCEMKLNPVAKKKALFGGLKLTSSKKDPNAVIVSVEDELENDPFNLAANESLYNAGLALDCIELAAFALETIRAGHPDNSKMMHTLAGLYMENDMPDRAVPVYRDILKHNPTDSNAIKGEKDASARASMRQQRWDQEGGSFRDVMKNSDQTANLEKSDKQGMTREEMEERLARLSAQYAENQQNLFTVRDIAATYEQMEDWANAASFYAYAYTLSNNDLSLKDKGDLMNQKLRDEQVAILEAQLKADPDNADLKAQVEEARKQRAAIQVSECERRVENNPTDPQLRYEFGLALFNSGEYTDAIPQLQRARNNPHIRSKAMLMLGKCYDSKDMFDMALRQLEEANKELNAMDSTKKEILYLMGTINEKMGKSKEALECFKVIYDADYSYMDVAQRVETSYKS